MVVVLRVRYLKLAVIALATAGAGTAGLLGASALWNGRTGDGAMTASTWIAGSRATVATDGRPFRGAADAPVTIVEFTDYQCPFCRRFARETLPRLLERYGDRLRYVVRNFPIPSLSANALPAAEAAECAHRQGRFWEYHDALFRADGRLTATGVLALAREVGLDPEAFGRCVNERATRDVVARDILDAWELGVAGTPTFFVNGRAVRGLRSLEEMGKYVELALESDGR